PTRNVEPTVVVKNKSEENKSTEENRKPVKRKIRDEEIRDIRDWLRSQPAYTLYKQARKKFQRNRIIVQSIDEQWQTDLVDMRKFERFNDGMKSIKMKPINVTKENEAQAFRNLYGVEKFRDLLKTQANEKEISVGDVVRLKKDIQTFEKSYNPLWTDEV
ncbi:hypothetical protein B4U79_06031, partial [Dinothrombium tinctorium]